MVLDKKLMKRIEDIEALPEKEKSLTISTWPSEIPKSKKLPRLKSKKPNRFFDWAYILKS